MNTQRRWNQFTVLSVDTERPSGKSSSSSLLATCTCGYYNEDLATEADHNKAHMDQKGCTRKLKFYRNGNRK